MRSGGLALLLLAACRNAPASDSAGAATPPPDASAAVDESPVPLNANSPILYPSELYARRIEGQVVLRLFVDERGVLRPESTRVAESSGYPAFDSAAVRGAVELRFAPARKNRTPVAAAFLQPVEFHHPAGSVLRGEP